MLTTIDTILFATDLGSDTKNSLRMAMSLAEKYQSTVTLLHAVEPVSSAIYGMGAETMWAEIMENGCKESEALSHKWVDQLFDEELSEYPSLEKPDIKVIYGNPTKTILECADDLNADIIVMGSHGHSALGELLIGSVADKVVRLSKRPVLLIPAVS